LARIGYLAGPADEKSANQELFMGPIALTRKRRAFDPIKMNIAIHIDRDAGCESRAVARERKLARRMGLQIKSSLRIGRFLLSPKPI
jgi:hypothetical protein